MSIDSTSGLSSAFDQSSFGSLVVSSTLDLMNNQSSGNSFAITDKESFGAAVVTKTFDYMNSGNSNSSDMSQTYEFNKTILGGHAASLGLVTDLNI